jgi:hypothetical protein
MLYLYLGFLLAQSHSVIKVIYTADIPLLTILFSIVVFLIWSLFPVLGYALARLIKAKGYCNRYVLFLLGFSISMIEQVLFQLDILNRKDGYATMLVTTSLFFIVAYLTLNKKKESA